jgi:YidC/Oxa1 family membrane protein insertase
LQPNFENKIMERNHLVGIILIFATLLIFNVVTAPSKEQLAQMKRERDSIALIAKPKQAEATTKIDTSTAQKVYGSLAPLAVAKDSTIVLENQDMKVYFSSKGGKISTVELKKYNKVSGDVKTVSSLVQLLEDSKNVYNLQINNGSQAISTKDLTFSANQKGNSIVFTLPIDGTKQVQQTYTLGSSGYTIDHMIATPGIPDQNIKLELVNNIDKIEKGFRYEQQMSTVYYKMAEGDELDYCSCTSDDNALVADKKLKWVSNTNQFFNTTIISKSGGFTSGDFTTEMRNFETDADLKKLTTKFAVPIQGGSHTMQWYVGPNEFNTLRSFNLGLEEIIPYGSGIFGGINRWIVRPFFEFLNGLVSSKGIVIILVIFLIKMMLYPLLYKTLHSQAKMSALKPELEKIKSKYKDDMQKQQVESMKIYQEFGVSPFAGCMPMVLQMPIWIALYRFFPSNITFRQESFLWAPDLSSYDAFFNMGFNIPFMGAHISLFTLLWAISTLIYTYYSTKDVDMSANPAMKYVQYFMPLMFLGFFNSYAAGLTCYMFFSNLINIFQTIFTKQFIFDQSKIRAELDKEKANPVKKKGFMAKMEEAMKMQQQMAEQKAKTEKKK